MKRYFLLAVTLLLFLTAIVYGQGDEGGESHLLHLQTGSFDPLATGQMRLAADLSGYAADVAQPYYIVQFNGPVDELSLAQIEQLGGEVFGYIPDNAHLVRLEGLEVEDVRTLPTVRWVGEVLPGYKLSYDLLHGSARAAGSTVELHIVGFPGEAAAALETFVAEQGGTITSYGRYAGGPVLRVEINSSQITAIAQNPAVQWVEEFERPQAANSQGRRILGGETVWQTFGYYGEGQIVGVSDSGLSVEGSLNADFAGRLLSAYAPSEMNLASADCQSRTTWTDINGHGTHVAGSVLGSGANSGANPVANQYGSSEAGVAPKAQLVFMAMNTDGSSGIQCIGENAEYLSKAYDDGARISTHSWGAGSDGSYNFNSMRVDDYLWQHKDYLVLFAAGNAGPGASTIGSPGTAKNVLTVGASENNRPDLSFSSDNPDEMAEFSSRGPTADGRVKPDVVAPGTNIVSVLGAQANPQFYGPFFGDPNYASSDGTSMATPLTAGAATLVREWLNKTRNIMNPSGALMKALMIHGAYQMAGYNSPNFDTGHGRVDLKNTLNAQYVVFDDHVQGVTTGQTVDYTVQIAGSSDEMGVLYAVPETLTAPAAAVTITPLTMSGQTMPIAPSLVSADPLPSASQPAEVAMPFEGEELPPGDTSGNFQEAEPDAAEAASFQMSLIGGGDFEDPGWTEFWSTVWLGGGVPERTSEPADVISGSYSMWLGGTPSSDYLLYPLSFPDQLATDFPSYLALDVVIANEDIFDGEIYDIFCVAMFDAAGDLMAPFAGGPECVGENGGYNYDLTFSAADLNSLAGQSGYLAVYTVSDEIEPHMSAFVDNVELVVDFPDPELTANPTSGPAGTTFLVSGKYNVPYGPVSVCLEDCLSGTILTSAYADAQGSFSAYVETDPADGSGSFVVQSNDFEGRTAELTLTLTGASAPTAEVTPSSGTAGTTFSVSASGFVPNDNDVQVALNGQFAGTVSSDSSGNVEFTISTQSNEAAGAYEVAVTDSAGRMATTSYTVTAPTGGQATMSVSPASGPAGTDFVFEGAGFDPHTAVSFELDGQSYGELEADAAGEFTANLSTETTMPPGTYVLQATQGAKSATAEFVITADGGGGGGAASGGLYVTLVWTDPPANLGAAKTLVNNLDLTVTAPDNTVYYGNGGNSADTVNNVEAIHLETVTAGTYTITVEASSVNGAFGSQPFALVATGRQSYGANAATTSIGGGGGEHTIYLPLVIR